jgi:hypothetical protein
MSRGEKTWDELAAEAHNGHSSQGAVVEAMRRLSSALDSQEKSSTALSSRILSLNVWLLVCTVALILLTLPLTIAEVRRLWDGLTGDEATLARFFSRGLFTVVAVAAGGAFGVYGLLATLKEQQREPDAAQRPFSGHASFMTNLYGVAYALFQFWFNAVGGFVGWVAVSFLWEEPFHSYGWRHLAVAVIAFSGVTGNLPYLSTGVRDALVGVGRRVRGE